MTSSGSRSRTHMSRLLTVGRNCQCYLAPFRLLCDAPTLEFTLGRVTRSIARPLVHTYCHHRNSRCYYRYCYCNSGTIITVISPGRCNYKLLERGKSESRAPVATHFLFSCVVESTKENVCARDFAHDSAPLRIRLSSSTRSSRRTKRDVPCGPLCVTGNRRLSSRCGRGNGRIALISKDKSCLVLTSSRFKGPRFGERINIFPHLPLSSLERDPRLRKNSGELRWRGARFFRAASLSPRCLSGTGLSRTRAFANATRKSI